MMQLGKHYTIYRCDWGSIPYGTLWLYTGVANNQLHFTDGYGAYFQLPVRPTKGLSVEVANPWIVELVEDE